MLSEVNEKQALYVDLKAILGSFDKKVMAQCDASVLFGVGLAS
ncbi:MAG: hypothetical protein ACI9IA_000256 [Enterobacterales bacterium]